MKRDTPFSPHEAHPDVDAVIGSSDRQFGFVFAIFFVLVALLGLYHDRRLWWLWGAAAVGLALIAWQKPGSLGPLNRTWTRLGLLLFGVVSPVVLALLFYTCIAPIGFLMRLSGKDPLRLKFDRTAGSYWIPRVPPGPPPSSLKDQF